MYYYSTLFRNRVALNKIFSSIIQWPVYWYLHSVHEIPIVYCCKLHVSLTKLCGREIALTKLCERDVAFFFKVDNPIVIVHIYLVLSWSSVRCSDASYPQLLCVLFKYGKYLIFIPFFNVLYERVYLDGAYHGSNMTRLMYIN